MHAMAQRYIHGSSLSIHDQFPSVVGAEKHQYSKLNINQAHILYTSGVLFHDYLPQNEKKPVILCVFTRVCAFPPSTLSLLPQPSTPCSLSLEQPPVSPKEDKLHAKYITLSWNLGP